MDNKQKAQQRADQIQAFHDEVKLLEAEQVVQLGADQREAVARYHEGLLKALTEKFDIDTSFRQKQLSTGMRIASFIGALALAASAFFLFYQFWGYFTTPVQVTLLLTAPLLTLVLTNTVVLSGVAYNRAGEPVAGIELTERELTLMPSYGVASENSGTAVILRWRVPGPEQGPGRLYGSAGPASWLDGAKLSELGFDVEDLKRDQARDEERNRYRWWLLSKE